MFLSLQLPYTPAEANANSFTHDPDTNIREGDIVNEDLPEGYDLLFSRDALQHLTYPQIVKALKNFGESDARFVMIG